MTGNIEEMQRALCLKHGADFCPPSPGSKLGMARDAATNIQPLNGLRHQAQCDTSGWYIWRGEKMSQKEDYFQPLHMEHMVEECPEALKFLALPPGWRFLVSENHIDVWYDANLL